MDWTVERPNPQYVRIVVNGQSYLLTPEDARRIGCAILNAAWETYLGAKPYDPEE